MSVELSPYIAPNAIAFMLAHLEPLGAGGPNRTDDDPLPFRMVNRIDGADDLTLLCDKAILSVHTFAPTMADVLRESDITHHRILLLADKLIDVPMHDGGVANVDHFDVHQRPIVSDYRVDGVIRTKGIYELHLAFT